MKSKWPSLIARILLGFVFAAGGLAFLLGLTPPPPEGLPPALVTFNAGLEATGYFMKFLKATEMICGFLLLSGYFVPLALVILAPIVVNIFLVHAVLMPQGLPLAVILGLLLAYLAFFSEPYSPRIRALFQPK
jgi:uncharacterized membrane protein YphA (DoxX/SURF4 family)